MFDRADMIFASVEDLQHLFGSAHVVAPHRAGPEVILKLAHPACHVLSEGALIEIAAEPVADVVDTTAAGDSFAAAYLAARIGGATPADAARAGHRLARIVVQYRGAIIPRAAMPV